ARTGGLVPRERDSHRRRRFHLLGSLADRENQVESFLSIFYISFIYASAAAGVRGGGPARLGDPRSGGALRHTAGPDRAAERARKGRRRVAARPPAQRRASHTGRPG